MTKIAIVGGGIAGSVLWLKLWERGVKARLYDKPSLSSSSRIAAGVVNPVVLKRLKIVKGADEFLPVMETDYPRWEALLGSRFFHSTTIKHLFLDAAEVNHWLELADSASHNKYLGEVSTQNYDVFSRNYGHGMVRHTAWLDTAKFLDAVAGYARSHDLYTNQQIDDAAFSKISNSHETSFVCTGHLMRKQFPETEAAFAPTRGEVMIIKSEDLPEDAIYHGPVFILPLGNNHFKVGATYHWDNLGDTPTEAGLLKLQTSLVKFFTGKYEVVEHLAGVRPNIKDRKPLLGFLKNGVYTLNGLGSRGALMAPHLADHLLQHVLDQKDLEAQYNISRFINP